MRINNLALVCALALIMIGSPNGSQAEPSKAEVKAYVMADQNKDRHLSLSEFTQFVSLMAEQGNPKAKRIRFFSAYDFAFGIADKNQDSLIDPSELITANIEN